MHHILSEVKKKYIKSIIGIKLDDNDKLLPLYIKDYGNEGGGFLGSLDLLRSKLTVQGALGLDFGIETAHIVPEFYTSLDEACIHTKRLDNEYVNLPKEHEKTAAVFMERNGHRQWKRGFTQNAYTLYPEGPIVSIPLSITTTIASLVNEKILIDMYLYYYSSINFPYPSLKEAVDWVDNGTQSVAFHRHYCIANAEFGPVVRYKGQHTIGRPTNKYGIKLFNHCEAFRFDLEDYIQ